MTAHFERRRCCLFGSQYRRIQANGRVIMIRQDAAATAIQGQWRKKQAKEKVQAVREDRAAGKIQGQFRMKKAREEVSEARSRPLRKGELIEGAYRNP